MSAPLIVPHKTKNYQIKQNKYEMHYKNRTIRRNKEDTITIKNNVGLKRFGDSIRARKQGNFVNTTSLLCKNSGDPYIYIQPISGLI